MSVGWAGAATIQAAATAPSSAGFVHQAVEAKLLPHERPHVGRLPNRLEEARELEQLRVSAVVKPGLDGNAVIKLRDAETGERGI